MLVQYPGACDPFREKARSSSRRNIFGQVIVNHNGVLVHRFEYFTLVGIGNFEGIEDSPNLGE